MASYFMEQAPFLYFRMIAEVYFQLKIQYFTTPVLPESAAGLVKLALSGGCGEQEFYKCGIFFFFCFQGFACLVLFFP